MLSLLFSFWQQKEKGNKKERLPSALFELLRHFSPLNKKNSLRSNSFLFLTLRKAPTLHAQKVRPDIPDATSLRSLRWMFFRGKYTCYLYDRAHKNKSTQKQAKQRLHHHPPHKFRHLVEEREEKWRFFREERKAV